MDMQTAKLFNLTCVTYNCSHVFNLLNIEKERSTVHDEDGIVNISQINFIGIIFCHSEEW